MSQLVIKLALVLIFVSSASLRAEDPGKSDSIILAIDGFCPVALVDQGKWVKGDARFTAEHQGIRYALSGEAEREVFYHDPNKYVPVLQGQDVVAAVDQELRVSGKRRFGVFHGKRYYLFASRSNRYKFEEFPDRYAQASQSLEAGGRPGRVSLEIGRGVSTAPPQLAVARVNDSGSVVIEEHRTVREETRRLQRIAGKDGKAQVVEIQEVVPVVVRSDAMLDVDSIAAYDVKGNPVDQASVIERLQTPQVVLIAAGSEMPDGSFLKPFKRNTLVIVIPGRGKATDAPAPGITVPSTTSPAGRESRRQSTEQSAKDN